MIDDCSVLGVILARGGSKGLPRKNVCDLAGKPLIAWTIEAGHESKYLDRLILSSDDEEIMEVAEEYGCEVPFRRPAELAQDDTPSMDALLHAMDQVPEYDYVVLLQPTSPLRTAEDIDATIERCYQAGTPACVTVTETEKPPQWMYNLDDEARLEPVLDSDEAVTRRQEAPTTYVLNGAVYAARTDWLRETRDFVTDQTRAHVMSEMRSADMDTALDLAWCAFLKQKGFEGEGEDSSRWR
jgi:N-acylneuraminate cytidylyltransferase